MFETQVANGDGPTPAILTKSRHESHWRQLGMFQLSANRLLLRRRASKAVSFSCSLQTPLWQDTCLRLSERARTREALAAAGRLDGSDSYRARFRAVPSPGELFPAPISQPSHFYIMGDGIDSLSCFVVVRSTVQVRSPPWSPDERKLIKQGVCPQAIRFLN